MAIFNGTVERGIRVNHGSESLHRDAGVDCQDQRREHLPAMWTNGSSTHQDTNFGGLGAARPRAPGTRQLPGERFAAGAHADDNYISFFDCGGHVCLPTS